MVGRFFTVIVYIAESIAWGATDADGNPCHSYCDGRGVAMSRNLDHAKREAQRLANKALNAAALAKWDGMGGTPILHTVDVTTPSGVRLSYSDGERRGYEIKPQTRRQRREADARRQAFYSRKAALEWASAA